MEDWAEIRRLHRAEGMPIKVIARVMGCSKNTVKRALAADGPPRYERAGRGSVVDEVEPRIRELLVAWPTMPATVIAERIGWDRSLTVLKDRVRELRPVYAPPDPASRTTYDAGEIAQCDFWFLRRRVAGRARAGAHRGGVAGADHGGRLLPVAVRAAGAQPGGGGPVRRLVGAAQRARRGAAGAGVGR